MKIKILQSCQSHGYDFKKDQTVDVPLLPGTEKAIHLNLLKLGFAQEVTESKPAESPK